MKNKAKKFNPWFLVTVGIIAVALIVVCVIVFNMPNGKLGKDDVEAYVSAYNRTNELSEYEMCFSTIVETDDGKIKQTAIDQIVKVDGSGKDLIYSVETVSTTTNATSGKTESEDVKYTYYNNMYYYDLPGIKYKDAIEEEKARHNLESFVNVISFPYEEMNILEKEENDGETTYYYNVKYENVSDYVKSVCEGAVNAVGEGTTFKRTAEMSATVKDGYVTKRTMTVSCVNEQGNSVNIEFVTELKNAKTDIEIPEDELYFEVVE